MFRDISYWECHYGITRSVDPRGSLPQQARILDPSLPLAADEMAVDVDFLNIDSASWTQLRLSTNDNAAAMANRILEIVRTSGKMHNPMTGSGGILVGSVAELGAGRSEPAVGTRIASLVSLTLTPLVLDEILELDPLSEKVRVRGQAILFGSSMYAPIPHDMPESVTLGVLDVCGAPAWVVQLAKPGMRVVILGAGGKAGSLCAAQAVRSVGSDGRVLGVCWPESTTRAAQTVGAATVVADARVPLSVLAGVSEAFQGDLADLVIACTNVAQCEGGALLACRDDGTVVFFSMATSFTAAALLAEGLGKSCRMIIGNGYAVGHADLALDLIRSFPELQALFAR